MVEYNDMPTPGTFDEAAAAIVDIQKSITRHSIMGYWIMGKMVAEMQAQESVYGSSITERVALELGKAGEKVCKKIVEEAHRAYKRCPKRADLEKIAAQGIKWSQLRAINRIGDNKTRSKVIKEVVDQRLTAAATVKHVTHALENKGVKAATVAPAELPTGHPTAFFVSTDSKLGRMESRIDRSEKELIDVSNDLKLIAEALDEHIRNTSDPTLVDDEQFALSCDSCKSISEKSGALLDRIRIHQGSMTSIVQGIENVLVQRLQKLDAEVSWADTEGES
jgi:hypothetical protein